jgi:outer membrane protein OmpA-like peptidoglycan-associated protein
VRYLAVCLGVSAASTIANAEDAALEPAFVEPAPQLNEPAPTPIEIGLYGGGFIANFYHQFYDYSLFPGQVGDPVNPVREELKRVSPLAGLRFAYFVKPWLGLEAEVQAIATATKYTDKSAKIYGGRVQLMFQLANLSRVVVPYVAIGDGFDRVVSPDTTLGSDTDWAPHVGAGVRFLLGSSIALRIDGRFLRAPSQQPPYHLNASLGTFMVGLSWHPGHVNAEAPPPPPEPKVDTDNDGVFDDVDRCPAEAEDKDLFDDADGCPDADNDADGVSDTDDKCSLEAEDKDGFEDSDGCVDRDNDGDGVADEQDKCGDEAEDKDGHDDLDGCPDPDNDGDGFADASDKCANEAETINGVDDNDGCPDRGDPLVVVMPDRLEMMESIAFKKITIQKQSNNLLGQIGATLKAHKEIKRLRITVHVQPSKTPEEDRRISKLRAFEIRDWLVIYGIDADRIEPRGFGGDKPLVDAKAKNAKAINERVELIILEKH